ncbi:MAG: MFS transporter [Candidatus Bathyarchaeia archaeon]
MMNEENRLTLKFTLAASFLVQMIVGITGIIIPLFARHMGATQLLLGFIGAAGGLTYTFMPLISGILSDKFRRRTFIAISTLLYGLSCIFYAMVRSPHMLISLRALEWCSVALFWPSAEALLAEAGGKRINRALEKFNLSWGSAMIISPMIGGLLVSALGADSPTPFICMSIILFALSCSSILVIKEKRLVSQDRREETNGRKRLNEQVVTAIAAIILFAFVGGTIISLFPAYAVDLGISASEVGLIMLFNGLFRLVAFLQAYKIESRIGEPRIFLLGSMMMALALALIAAGRTTLIFSVALSIAGFSAGILYAESISVMLKNWGHARGYAAGLFESLIGVGYFLGPLLGGAAANEYAPNAPYILGFIASLAVAITLALKRLSGRRPGACVKVPL